MKPYKPSPNRKSERKRSLDRGCIFCRKVESLTLFKGKFVCHLCLRHIPNLFLPASK